MAEGNNDMLKFVGILVLAWLVFGGGRLGGQGTGDTTTGNGGITTVLATGCNYAPTVQLQEVDKWDASKPKPSEFTFILNAGNSQTDADGSFEVTKDDSLIVLWGNDNTTLYYRDIGTYTIGKCGLNVIKSTTGLQSGQEGLISNTTMIIQCFNEEGNLIDDITENETLGNGDFVSLECEIRGVSETGMPHGGILVVELNKTEYVEKDFSLTGDIIAGTATVPEAYSVRDTDSTQKAYKINPIIGAGVTKFFANIQVETTNGINPSSGPGDDITLKLYGIDAFHNTDLGTYDIAVEDQDNVFIKGLVGQETIQVD